MFTIYPMFRELLEYFGLPTLPPLPGRIDFDDRGILVGGRPPTFNAELRLLGDLAGYQAAVSPSVFTFTGSQTFRFEVRVPYSDKLAQAQALRGEVLVWDRDRDTELERIPVSVPRIVMLHQLKSTHRWVLDLGGQNTLIGGERARPGLLPAFLPYPGMPIPSTVALVSGHAGAAPRLELPDEHAGNDPAGVVISGLKALLDRSESGPADAYPYTGAELNAFYLGRLFKQAILEAHGLPDELVITVPAGYSPQQVDQYRNVICQAFDGIGVAPPRIVVIDEATAGQVGVHQERLEEVDGPAMEHVLSGRGEDFYSLGVDIGATTTDLSVIRIHIVREGRVRVANTKLEAVVGLPVGGSAYTRLVMLCQLARLALKNPPVAVGEGAAKTHPAEVQAVANGEIAGFNDPLLNDPANPKTRLVLDYLAAFLPPHNDEDAAGSRADRTALFEVAEQLKTKLHTPLDERTPDVYPERAELSGEAADAWAWLCDYHQRAGMDETATLDASTLGRLFAPALDQLVQVVAGLCRSQSDRHPVDAICLTGNGSRLRELRSRSGNVLLEGLTDDVFDRHPLRLFHAREPKLAVAKGAFAVFHAAAEKRDWEWRCAGLLEVLPYELGRLTTGGDFEMLVPRGTQLPHEVVPPNRPRQLTLFKRAYPGDKPEPIGTVTFASAEEDAEPSIKIDRERRVTNQAGNPIVPPPASSNADRMSW